MQQSLRGHVGWCVWGAITLIMSVVPSYAQPVSSRTTDARDRATRQLAVHTAARRFWEALPALGSPGEERLASLREQLRTAMQEDPETHRHQSKSKKVTKTIARERQEAWLTALREQMLEEARNQSPLPVSAEDWDAALGERGTQRMAEEQSTFEEKVFPELYQKARELAVASMRATLDRRVQQPAFDELDAKLLALGGGGFVGRPWPAVAEEGLRDWLAPFVGLDDMPLFEEVEAYARGLARQEADRIRGQYLQQVETADRKMEVPAIAALRLAADISAQTVDRVSEEYDVPVFTGVRKYIEDLAVKTEGARLRDYVQETPLIQISDDALVERIRADWQSHRSRDASRNLALVFYREKLIPPVASSYAGEIDHAKPHFASQLQDRETEAGAAFTTRVVETLDEVFPEVRDALSTAQWSRKGAVLDDMQTLPDAVLEGIVARNGQVWDELDPALAWFASLEKELVPKDVERDLLLEENETRMLSQIHDLVRAGYEAVQAQLAALRELERDRSAQLQEEVQAGRTYEELHADWHQALVDIWAGHVEEHPHYPDITPPTEEALDRAVRQFFDTVRQTAEEETLLVDAEETAEVPEDAAETAADDTVEPQEVVAEQDTSQDEDEDDEDEEEDSEDEEDGGAGSDVSMDTDKGARIAPDILLLLRGDDEERVQVELLVRGADRGEVWEVDASDPEASAKQLFERIEPVLAGLAKEGFPAAPRFLGIWRRQPTPLHFYTVVESPAVRHRMSLLLHEKIEDYLRQHLASDAPVSLRWETGLQP